MSDYNVNGTDLDNLLELRAGRTPIAPSSSGYFNQGQSFEDRYLYINHPDALTGPPTGYNVLNLYDVGAQFGANPFSFVASNKITDNDSSTWNGQQDVSIQVTWASGAARDEFFDYSGQIRVASLRSGGSTTGQTGSNNTVVSNTLSDSGTVFFNLTNTTNSGGGMPTSIGYNDLTTSNQLIYSNTPTGAYYSSSFEYRIFARLANTDVIIFTMEYEEQLLGSVNGTLSMTMGERRHSSLASPAYANINPL